MWIPTTPATQEPGNRQLSNLSPQGLDNLVPKERGWELGEQLWVNATQDYGRPYMLVLVDVSVSKRTTLF